MLAKLTEVLLDDIQIFDAFLARAQRTDGSADSVNPNAVVLNADVAPLVIP